MEINKLNQNKPDKRPEKKLGRGIGSLLGGAGAEYSSQELALGTNSAAQSAKTVYTQSQNTQHTSSVPAIDPEKRVWSIAIDKLVPGQYQPRKKFEKQALEELAQSIKENGILQPIVVRKRAAGGYEIVAGERRWRAAQIAGLHEVSALIREYSDKEALQLALIENIQREDLDAIEEAESYQRLMQEFSYSQAQVAEKVGKERSTVANAIRLIALPNEIKDMISEKLLSVGHAKALLAEPTKTEQIKLAKISIEKGLSVRALEALVKKSTQGDGQMGSKPGSDTGADPMKQDLSQRLALELAEQLQKSLGTKVQINYKAGKGDLTIHFYSDDQLNTIYEKINQ